MKTLAFAAALALLSSSAFAAGSTVAKTSNSNGSAVGQSSSSYTGNGATISGNGDTVVGPDQTTGPHSRPDAVNGAFPGSNNAGGNSGAAPGHNK